MNNTFRQVAIAWSCIAAFSGACLLLSLAVNKPIEYAKTADDVRIENGIHLMEYTEKREKCTYERPGSEEYLDCMWEAKRDYPKGYALYESNELLRLAAESGYDVKAN